MGPSAKLERLFLLHVWACAPFALLWVVWPEVFGRQYDAEVVRGMRALYTAAGVVLAVRTYWAFHPKAQGFYERLGSRLGPLLDIVWITAAALINKPGPDSWIVILYLLPVLQASFSLDLRWSGLVGGLAAAAFLFASGAAGIENLRYSFFAFQLFFLVLAASMVTLLSRELSRAQQELAVASYRSELAGEMHDGLQQYLVGMALRLDLAKRLVATDPAAAAEMASQQADVARQAADELRLLVRRMRRAGEGGSGLAESIRQQAALFEERSGLRTSFACVGRERAVDPKTEHAFIRIAQESLTNALKHAEASHVQVVLTFKESRATIEVRDDGRGFDPATTSEGFGIETIRLRAASVGGEVSVTSAPGEGVCVRAWAPLPSAIPRGPFQPSRYAGNR